MLNLAPFQVLEVHPEPIEDFDVLFELRFEARKARGEVVLQSRLDVASDLRHRTVHIL